jgi:hypothetical protein
MMDSNKWELENICLTHVIAQTTVLRLMSTGRKTFCNPTNHGRRVAEVQKRFETDASSHGRRGT